MGRNRPEPFAALNFCSCLYLRRENGHRRRTAPLRISPSAGSSSLISLLIYDADTRVPLCFSLPSSIFHLPSTFTLLLVILASIHLHSATRRYLHPSTFTLPRIHSCIHPLSHYHASILASIHHTLLRIHSCIRPDRPIVNSMPITETHANTLCQCRGNTQWHSTTSITTLSMVLSSVGSVRPASWPKRAAGSVTYATVHTA